MDKISDPEKLAADCNHDSVVDADDVELLEQSGLLLESVSQTVPA